MTHLCDISSSFLAGSTVAEASHRASRGHAPVLWSARVERREWRELPPHGRPARARARSPGGYVLYVRRRGAIFHKDRHCRPRRAIRPRRCTAQLNTTVVVVVAYHNLSEPCYKQSCRTQILRERMARPRPPPTTGDNGCGWHSLRPPTGGGRGTERGTRGKGFDSSGVWLVLIAVEAHEAPLFEDPNSNESSPFPTPP